MITTKELRELRIAIRLWELGKGDPLVGVTEPGDVKKRIRAAILGANLGQSIGHVVAFANGKGESVTLAQAFELTYGETLIESWETAA
jgi:hypothetical protein